MILKPPLIMALITRKVEPSSDEEQESLYHIEDLALFQVDEEIKTSRNYINRARHQAVIM